MNDLVTVVLTSYNKEKFLRKSLESVLNQSYKNLEILIFDNASTDGSMAYLKSISDSRVKVFSNPENIGSVRNINHALTQNLSGKYIAIQHGDDVWDFKKIETQLDYFRQNPDWEACFTSAEPIDQLGNKLEDSTHFYFNAFDYYFEKSSDGLERLLTHGNFLCMPSVMFKNNIIKKLGLFDPKYSLLPDMDMWIRLFSTAQVGITKEVLTKFRVGIDNESSSGFYNANRSRNEAFILLSSHFNAGKKNQREYTFDYLRSLFTRSTSDMAKLAMLARMSTLVNPQNDQLKLSQLHEAISKFELEEVKGLNFRLLESQAGLISAKKRLVAIERSFSWRITAPARWLGSKLQLEAKERPSDGN